MQMNCTLFGLYYLIAGCGGISAVLLSLGLIRCTSYDVSLGDFKCNLSPSAKLKSSWEPDKNISLHFDPQVILLPPARGLFRSSLMYGMYPSG